MSETSLEESSPVNNAISKLKINVTSSASYTCIIYVSDVNGQTSSVESHAYMVYPFGKYVSVIAYKIANTVESQPYILCISIKSNLICLYTGKIVIHINNLTLNSQTHAEINHSESFGHTCHHFYVYCMVMVKPDIIHASSASACSLSYSLSS